MISTHPTPPHVVAGLRQLAHAYSGSQTVPVLGGKKAYTATLLEAMSAETTLAEHLNGLLRQMTTVSNGLMIRHEMGKADFYSGYDLLRCAPHGPFGNRCSATAEARAAGSSWRPNCAAP